MKSRVKSAGLIVAVFMVFGAGCSSSTEINSHSKTYKIGDKGPAGGWVFYDKGNSEEGWRYLEAAPEDQGRVKWGCDGKSIPDAQGTVIGTGKSNTKAIVKWCNETAARVASSYRGGGKRDWFLPSNYELNLIYTNLHKARIGGFSDDYYWSSSDDPVWDAWSQNFSNGNQRCFTKTNQARVRAVRAF